MVPRLASHLSRNQRQVSGARLWKLASFQYLLQTVCHPCSSYMVQRDENHCAQHWQCRKASQQHTSHNAATNHKSVGRMETNDFHIFGPLTKHLAGKRFAPDTHRKQDVISWLQTLDTNFFYNSRTSHGAILWQTFKYQWWLCADLMCTTYYPCAMYTRRSK